MAPSIRSEFDVLQGQAARNFLRRFLYRRRCRNEPSVVEFRNPSCEADGHTGAAPLIEYGRTDASPAQPALLVIDCIPLPSHFLKLRQQAGSVRDSPWRGLAKLVVGKIGARCRR